MAAPTTVATSTPQRQSSSASLDKDDKVVTSNIEVCVRVRPLAISSSTTKFFETAATPRKRTSRLSRLGSLKKTPNRTPESSRTRLQDTRPAWNVVGNDTVQQSKSSSRTRLQDTRPAWNVVGNDTVQQSKSTTHIQGRTKTYTVDRVYGPDSSTDNIYDTSLQGIIRSAMDGYHASVFAYGQTSTGKTFTMTGTKESPGIVPLAVEDCFRMIETNVEAREYLLRVSYLEIYNEQIIDLLVANPQPVRIFESAGEIVVRGLREEVVSTPQQVFSLICQGEARRQVGSTNMNRHSSRSHTIFRVWIESRPSSVKHSKVRISSLSLVDLAGSESIRLSGATGERSKEGQYINKSLMALGQVVYKLSSEQKKGHIPYRDSKLTRLLQPSLSGNAQICVICNISPQTCHQEESHNTLKFAIRAKRIQQKAHLTEVTDEKTLLESYRAEIQDLKQQLQQAREAQARTTGDDDTRELVQAIKKMERLILKAHGSEEQDDDDDLLNLEEDEEPKDVVNELHRIQGLLSTVLVKRDGFSTPPRDREVEDLRAQLHEKEVTTSLRKADSSFLQSQLAEKDMLLAEVSKVLEEVEKRQLELENENIALKEKLANALEELDRTQRSKAMLEKQFERAQDQLVDRQVGVVSNGSHLYR